MIVRLLPILGITFIDILGFSILIPILPYFVKHFGASDVVVGLLFSTFAACQFLAGPLWGYVSDRIGRKAVLIISQIGATIGWAMLAFAQNIGTVFAARIVEGAAGGNISVTQAYVADLVEPEQRARAFAYVGAAFSSGIVFGPVLGGLLFDRFGFAAPFLAAAALQLFTLGLTAVMLPESHGAAARAQTATLGDIGASLRDPRLSPILWQQWAFSLGLYAWFGVFALLLRAALNFSASQTSYVFATFGLLSVVMQAVVVGAVSDRIGDRATSNVGIACAAAGFACVPFAHSLATLAPVLLFFVAGMSLSRPSLTALLTRATPANQRGTILGVGSSLDSLSGVLMPPVSTSILERFGSPFAGAASLFFSSLALLAGLVQQRREQRVALAVAAGAASAAPANPTEATVTD